MVFIENIILRLVAVSLTIGVVAGSTEFIFGFTENGAGAEGRVYIGNPTTAEAAVVVRTPLDTGPARLEECLVLAPGQHTHVIYRDMMTGTAVQDKGVYVWSDQNIVVQGLSTLQSMSSDAFMVAEVGRLGTSYMAVTHRNSNGGLYPEFQGPYVIGVVATENDTNVTFDLTAEYTIVITLNGVTYTNGQQFSVSLQKFQTVQLRTVFDEASTSSGDLTGVGIYSDKPVYAQSGAVLTSVYGGAVDTIKTTLYDTSQFVTEVFILPLQVTPGTSFARIVCIHDTTEIKVYLQNNFVSTQYRNKGQHLFIAISPGLGYYFRTNKPVMAVQICKSRTVPSETGDPFMASFPGMSQFGSEYYVMTMSNQDNMTYDTHFTLVTGENDTGSVYYDTTNLGNATWSNIPAGGVSGIAYMPSQLTEGLHHIYSTTESPLGGILYGISPAEAYGMALQPYHRQPVLEQTNDFIQIIVDVIHRDSVLTDLSHNDVIRVGAMNLMECLGHCKLNPCVCGYVQQTATGECYVIKPGGLRQMTYEKGAHIYKS